MGFAWNWKNDSLTIVMISVSMMSYLFYEFNHFDITWTCNSGYWLGYIFSITNAALSSGKCENYTIPNPSTYNSDVCQWQIAFLFCISGMKSSASSALPTFAWYDLHSKLKTTMWSLFYL